MSFTSNLKKYVRGKFSKPKSLYDLSINIIANEYRTLRHDFPVFPPNIYFDLLYGLFQNELLEELAEELLDLNNFCKLLKVSSKRLDLHRCFQAITDQSFSDKLRKPSAILAEKFVNKCMEIKLVNKPIDDLVHEGFLISSFMSEAGWLEEAETILSHCRDILIKSQNKKNCVKLLECFQRLLHVQNGYCQFKSSLNTYQESLELLTVLKASGEPVNYALLYSEFSSLFMLRSEYTQAFDWSMKALQELVPNTSKPALVDVYRQAAKTCVLKRKFKKAELLIKEAFKLSRDIMEARTLKYADTLTDFGFYLLNVDALSQGTQVYDLALKERLLVFGLRAKNLRVAASYEDLSYASYVLNYSSGTFIKAEISAEKAISLLLLLLPKDHLLLSSCKRVKALILEEMAIENGDKALEAKYLGEAHNLHSEALTLTLEAFGENNVQTAKHYGNLGRLYQSMNNIKKAKEMHLKSLRIKEFLLGPDDYEVALSSGHLASIYNYDLEWYSKAEVLYLRSIEIGKKLFGEAYSGLEYDYRGLLRIYTNQRDLDNKFRYQAIFYNWKAMRENLDETAASPFNISGQPLTVEHTLKKLETL